jgi:hypothetical protein
LDGLRNHLSLNLDFMFKIKLIQKNCPKYLGKTFCNSLFYWRLVNYNYDTKSYKRCFEQSSLESLDETKTYEYSYTETFIEKCIKDGSWKIMNP